MRASTSRRGTCNTASCVCRGASATYRPAAARAARPMSTRTCAARRSRPLARAGRSRESLSHKVSKCWRHAAKPIPHMRDGTSKVLSNRGSQRNSPNMSNFSQCVCALCRFRVRIRSQKSMGRGSLRSSSNRRVGAISEHLRYKAVQNWVLSLCFASFICVISLSILPACYA